LPDIPKRNIDPNFKFNFELTECTRKMYSIEINAQINKEILERAFSNSISEEFLSKLIEYCKIVPFLESISVPVKMMKLICKYYSRNDDLIEVPTIREDELDIRTPQKRLIQLFLNDLGLKTPEWVSENFTFLQEVLSLGMVYKDWEAMFLSAKIFPNQLNELNVQSDLAIDDNIPEELKDYFDTILEQDLPIRSKLIRSDFADFLKNKEKRTPKSLGDIIESKFSPDGQYSNINNNPFKKFILDIIERITKDDSWTLYFPFLNSNRAKIVLDTFLDEETKEAVFSIVRLDPEKINSLGKLAVNPNFELIIAYGKKVIEDEQKRKTDFQFKLAIGKNIENIIREKLGRELEKFSVEPKDVQNGQDIVIKHNDTELYFIEVKSRWNSDSPILMSKPQFTNAAENKDKYALCCVEMSKYKVGSPERYKVDDVSIIFNEIKIIDTIGKEIEPLMKGILKANDIENEITLAGDYKASIPMKLIKGGSNIDMFVVHLIDKLNLHQYIKTI